MIYGMPYKGSKTKIADKLLNVLPKGKRFVDLFGGGGAMTHAAALSGKYEKYLYNEIQEHIGILFYSAVNGLLTDTTPEWISRKTFYETKDENGYVAICWSFSNNCRDYLYGKHREKLEHDIFDFIVHRRIGRHLLEKVPMHILNQITSSDWNTRRLSFRRLTKDYLDVRLVALERFLRLKKLVELRNFPIETTYSNYNTYEYQDGDIVYCDIPYENTNKYNVNFDKDAFIQWATTRPYPVYISEYNLPFKCIWSTTKTSSFSATNNAYHTVEKLYINETP